MKECPYCTTRIEDDARFCTHCMKELETKVYYADKIPLIHRSVFLGAIGIFIIIVLILLQILFAATEQQHATRTEPASSAPTATATSLSLPKTQSCRLLAERGNQRLGNVIRKEQQLRHSYSLERWDGRGHDRMTRDEQRKKLFQTYHMVSLLSGKNDCQVLRLRHKTLGRDLVMHVLPQESKVYDILCSVRSAHLPAIYDVYSLEDGIIILEEYIDGITLDQYLEAQKLTKKEAIYIAKSLCYGLAVLHEKGIVHRDIKPENIMIDGKGTVKLIDFNASRIHSSACKDTIILGTIGYAAPEQFGITQSDPRTDIYAMGILINTMITGTHPCEKLITGILGQIVKKCTHINPDARYQSAEKLYRALCGAAPYTRNTLLRQTEDGVRLRKQ